MTDEEIEQAIADKAWCVFSCEAECKPRHLVRILNKVPGTLIMHKVVDLDGDEFLLYVHEVLRLATASELLSQ